MMRARLLALLAILAIATMNLWAIADARPSTIARITLAQTPEQPQEEDVTGEEQTGEGEGQSDPEAETGAGGESGEAAPEEGPLWTWQMARIALLGVLPLLAAIGYWYWRFVGSRARET